MLFLIPELKELTEYDVGGHIEDIQKIGVEIQRLDRVMKSKPWKEWKIWEAKIHALEKKKKERIEQAQVTVALVNNEKKAKRAIQFFISSTDKYQKCEIDIIRAKL